MSFEYLVDGNLWQVAAPDGDSFILPRVRDPRVDIAVTLGTLLGIAGLSNNFDGTTGMNPGRQLTIVKNGSFHQSYIRDADYVGRPVINIARAGNETERLGIGRVSGGRINSNDLMQEPSPDPNRLAPTIPPNTIVSQSAKKKTTTIELDIFDLNMGIADGLTDLVESTMDHVVELVLMQQLGYLEVLATARNDSTSFTEPQTGDPYFIYQRSLDYRTTWVSVAYQQDQIRTLVSQMLTLEEQVGDGPAVETDL